MSNDPSTGRSSTATARRTGRPPLTERRKAQTRLEIAREAVRLFTTSGVAATSVEDIAVAAGISVRTFWRYFSSKENCVSPLFTAGIEAMSRLLLSWRPGEKVADLVGAEAHTVASLIGDTPTLLALVRLARTEPALRAVWLQAHDSAEMVFASALARSTGLPSDGLHCRVRAAMVNGALRAAVEHHAWHTASAEPSRTDEDGLVEAVCDALETAVRGL